MLKNLQLAEESIAAIWAYEENRLKSIGGGFSLEGLKKWVGTYSSDSQLGDFTSKYNIKQSTKNDIVAACTSLNADFIGEDEIYDGRVNKKILFDYHIYTLVRISPEEEGGVIGVYIVHENDLKPEQVAAISSKLGFKIKGSINKNIDILE